MNTEPEDKNKKPKPLTPEEIAKMETRLQAGKFYIYKNYPFLGHIIQRLGTVITNDIPTMAVDNSGNIYLNPKFSMELPYDEFVGVLVHETMHIATLTFMRERGRDHQMWNIATDYIMNRDILRSGMKLPSIGCNPTKDSSNNNYYVEFQGKNGKVKIDVTDATAEYLYTQMLKHAVKITVTSLDQVIKGKGEGDKDGNGKPKPIPGTNDGSVDKSPDQIKNDITVAEEASKNDQADIEKNRGEGSGGLRHHVMDVHRPKVNWRQLLKSIVAKTVTEYNWKRPQKRAMASGYYAPRSQTQDNLAPIAVAIDTSGSITQKELTVFVTEIQNIFKFYPRATMTIIMWESEAYYSVTMTNQNVSSILNTLLKHIRYGGTNMSSVADYMVKNHLDRAVKAVIYLTDGHVEGNPKILPYPVKNYALVTDTHGLKGLLTVKGLNSYPIDIN